MDNRCVEEKIKVKTYVVKGDSVFAVDFDGKEHLFLTCHNASIADAESLASKFISYALFTDPCLVIMEAKHG